MFGERWTLNVRAVKFSDLVILDKSSMDTILIRFPTEAPRIRFMAMQSQQGSDATEVQMLERTRGDTATPTSGSCGESEGVCRLSAADRVVADVERWVH